MRHLLLSSGEGVLRCVRRKAEIPLRDAGAGSRGFDSRSLSAVRVLARHACHGRRDDGLCVDHGSPTCTPGSTRERSTSLRRPFIHATEGHHLKVSIYYNMPQFISRPLPLQPVELSAVVPQELAFGLLGQGHPQKPVHRLGVFGAPGVFGRKFTVSPSALVFTDLPLLGDQKGYRQLALFRPAKSRFLSRVCTDHLRNLFDRHEQ